jgi:hypothetical protein
MKFPEDKEQDDLSVLGLLIDLAVTIGIEVEVVAGPVAMLEEQLCNGGLPSPTFSAKSKQIQPLLFL